MGLNVFAVLKPILRAVVRIAGVTPQKIEIQPGTVMNFWVPTRSSSKPSVVFVHGFLADGILTWLFQVLSLTSKYDVYVPDLLFFGDSITDSPHRSTSFQAECLAKGLKKLGVERCTAVGFSYGGMVGFKLAKLYPSLVEALVASSTVMELTETINNASLTAIGFPSWPELLLLPKTVAGLKVLLSICSHGKTFTGFPDFAYKHFLEVMFENRKERAELLKAFVVPDNEFSPADYSQKFHLLWGENDKIFNLEFADQLKRQLGEKASLRVIEEAGHLVQLEQPLIYNQHLKKILASLHM